MSDICIKQIETDIIDFFDYINEYENGTHIDLCKLPENQKLALKFRQYWSYPDMNYEGFSLELVRYSEKFKWVGRDYYSEDEEILSEIRGYDYFGFDDDKYQKYQKIRTKLIIKWCSKNLEDLRLTGYTKLKLRALSRNARKRVIKKKLDKTCLCNDLQNHIIKFLL